MNVLETRISTPQWVMGSLKLPATFLLTRCDFYFFGRDLGAGDTVTWRLRWVIGQHLTDEEIRSQWEAFT
jgi:hypothetical protein